MKMYNYSIIAFVLGVVLGVTAEENLDRSLQLSDGSWAIFVSPDQPLALGLSTVIFLLVMGPLIKPYLSRLLKRT